MTALAPVATITGLSNDTGRYANDFITNATSQTVTGTLSVPLNAGGKVQVSTDGVTWLDATLGSSGTDWSAGGVTLLVGNHQLSVRTIDAAGKATAGVGHSYLLDQTAPSVVATIAKLSADTGSSATDFVTKTASQTVSGTFTGTRNAGDLIQVSTDGGSTWVYATAGTGTWSANVTLVAGGSLLVRTVDTAGNSTEAVSHAYLLDTAPPNAPIITTMSPAQSNAAAITVSGAAEAGSLVTLYNNGSTLVGTVTADGSGAWSVADVPLSDGLDYSFTAKAADAAGNVSAASAALTLHDDRTAPNAPVITTTSPAQTSAAAITVSGTAEVGSTVKLYNGAIQVGVATANSLGAWSVAGVPLSDGLDYSFTAKAADAAGNVSAASNTLTLHDDRTPPAAVATITGLSNDTGRYANDFITNATSQTVTGTLSAPLNAGEKVQVSTDGVVWLDATLGSSGTDWSAGGVTLLVGNHQLSVRTIDAAGNATAGVGHSYLLDQTAPSVVATIAKLSADTGSSATDFVTKTASQTVSGTFTGTRNAGDLIQVSTDGGSTWVYATAGTGTWSANVTLVAGGSLLVRTVDTAGNSTEAVSHAYLLDTAPPDAPIITTMSPAQSNAAAITVSGAAEAGSLVTLYNNGSTLVGTVTADGSGAWSVADVPLSDGLNYSFTATAADAAGNVSAASAALTLHDDRTAPNAPVITTTSPAQTSAAAITVSGTAEVGSTVKLYNGAIQVGVATANSLGAWSVAGVPLSDGLDYSFTAKAADAAGNVSAASNTLTLHDDRTPPAAVATITGLSNDTGRYANDFITNATSQTVTGTLSAPLNAGEKVQVSTDGVVWLDATLGSSGTDWSAGGVTLLVGNHQLSVRTIDAAGNATAGVGHSYLLDQTAPSVVATIAKLSADTGSSATDFVTKTASQTVSGTFTGTRNAGDLIQVSTDGGSTWVYATAGTGTWSANVTLVAGGSLLVRTVDTAGNSTEAVSHAYLLDTAPPNAPIITTMSPAQSNAAAITVSGAAEAGSLVTLYNNGSTLVGTVTADGSGAWSVADVPLSDGLNYSFTATAADAAGNVSAASAALTLHDDRTAPDAPIITTMSPAQSNAAAITVSGAAEAGSLVTLYNNGSTLVGTVTADGSGAWSVADVPLSDGLNYSFTATAADAAGNVSAASAALTLHDDRTAPDAPVITTMSPAQSNAAAITVSGAAEAGSLVTLYNNGSTLVGTVTADGSGAWSVADVPLSDGLNYSFTATAADAAGNVSAASAALTLHDDRTAPNAPVIATMSPAQSNAAAITVSGAAEAGSLVTLYNNGSTLVGTVTADGSGAWSVADVPLSDGLNYSFTATAADAAGNVSAASAALTLHDDRTAPDAPVIATMSPAQSNAAAITVSGAAEAGSVVTLYNNGSTLVGTVTADGSGAWSVADVPLSDGLNYSFTATAADAAGNVSAASAALTLHDDRTAPDAPIITTMSPAQSNAAAITVSGAAEAGSLVTLYNNGSTLVGTVTADGSGAWSVADVPLSDGLNYSFTATAADAAGNVSAASNALTLHDDRTAPDAPIITTMSPAQSNAAAITVSGAAEAGSLVTLYNNGSTLVGTVTADGSGAWSVADVPLSDGLNYSFTATAADAAGNVSAASAALTLHDDRTAPDAPIITTMSPAQSNAAAITVSGAAEAGSVVTLYNNGSTLVGTVTADGSGAWSVADVPLSDGLNYSFTATAADAAGNVSAASAALTLHDDRTAPDAPIITTMSPAQSNAAAITVSGAAEAGSLVTLYNNGSTLVGTVTADGSGAWSVADVPLSDGLNYSFTATAADAAGNVSAASNALTLHDDRTAPDAPIITTMSPAQSNAAAITVSGAAEAGSLVTLYNNGSTLVGTVTADGSGAWSVADVPLSDGLNYSFTATAADAAGNVSAASAALTLHDDRTAPDAPIITTMSPAQSNAAAITVSGAAEAGSVVTLYNNGSTLVGTVTADGSGAWSVADVPLSDGLDYSFTATAADAAGNVSAASNALTLHDDRTAPDAPIIATMSPAQSNAAAITVSGTAEVGSVVTLYDNGSTQVGVATADALGAWSVADVPLSDGLDYSFTAKAADAAGNVSAASNALTLHDDRTAPDAPIIATMSPAQSNAAAITVSGTAEAGSLVTLYNNGSTLVGTVTADGSGAWSVADVPLSDGLNYSFTATAADAAGNVSAASAALTLHDDRTAPDAPVIATMSPAQSNAAAITVSGAAEAGSVVTLYNNGSTLVGTVTADGSGAWSVADVPLSDGLNYSFTATAADAAGNVSAASAALTLHDDRTAPDAPIITTMSPAQSNAAAITVSGAAEAGSLVTLYNNGSTLVGTVTADGSGAWSVADVPLSDGLNYSFTATAADAAGNVSAASAALTLHDDRTAPDAPVIATMSPAQSNAAAITVSGAAEAGSVVTLYNNGSTLVGTVTADGSGAWSVADVPLSDGLNYSFTATAADAAGNVSAASAALTLHDDRTAPDAPIITTMSPAQSNAAAITVSGAAEAGSLVTLYNNGSTLVGTVTADGSGAWSVADVPLSDGLNYSFTATAADAAGNVSAASNALTLHDDRTAPDAPIITTMSPAQSNAAAITVSGAAEAGSLVTLYNNGSTLVGTVTADGSGAWSVADVPLSDGLNYSFTATAADAAGNVSAASAALTLHDDRTAPDAPIITTMSPAQSNAAAITVSGAAEAGSVVTLYNNGSTLVGTVTADGSGAWSVADVPLSDGLNYSFTATAADAAGNVSAASAALTLHDDRTAPDAPIITTMSPAQSNAAAITVSGAAEAGSLVTLYNNGSTLVGTVTADGSGAWSVADVPLSDGLNYSFTATAADAAGNVSAASAALTLHDDRTAPDAPVIATMSPAQSNAAAITVSGAAEAGSVVTLYNNGSTLVGTVTADGSGAWSVADVPLSDGLNYSFTATAADAAGNVSAASAALTLHDDRTAPDAPIITTMSPAQSNAAAITVSGAAEAGSLVTLYNNGSTLVGTVTADGSGAWSVADVPLSDGLNYSFTATAADAAGNVSAASAALTLHDDRTAPVVSSVTAPSGADGPGAVVAFNINFNEAVTVSGGTPTLVLSNGATATYNAGSSTSTTLVFNYTVGATGSSQDSLDLGTATTDALVLNGATIRDNAGNNATLTGANNANPSGTLMIDTTAPAAPTISGVGEGGAIGGADNVVSGQTGDNTVTGTAEANSTVTVYSGATQLGTATASGGGAWTYTLTSGNLTTLGQGAGKSVTATATDAAGNVGTASSAFAFAVDTAAPGAPTIGGVGEGGALGGADNVVSGQTGDNTVTGTAEANSTVTVYSGATQLGTATASGGGAWTYTLTSGNLTTLGQGTGKSVTATATDAAGNVGTASSAFAFAVDTAAPGAPTIGGVGEGGALGGADNVVSGQTGDNTVTGTAEANSTVTVYSGATQLGTATASGGGAWTYTLTSGNLTTLGQGAGKSVTATATDAAGNTGSASTAFTFAVDTAAPGAPTIGGVGEGGALGGADNVVSGQTGDNTVTGTAEANSTVTLYSGATQLGTATASGGGAWTYALTSGNLTTLGQGTGKSVTAKATDAAGNTGSASSAFTFAVDTVAPSAIATVASLSSDTGVSSSDFITDVAAQTVSGTLTAALGSGESLQFSSNGGTSWSTVTPTGTTWSTSVTLSGSGTLSARTIDTAGNITTGSSHSYTLDTTAPTVSSVAAPAGLDGPGAVVPFTVNFSEAVTVAGGTPTLRLSNTASATYASGSGTSALVFNYTVGATGSGQDATDLGTRTAGTALQLGVATIQDTAGNTATLTGANNQNPTGTLQIDTTAPSQPLASITYTSATHTLAGAATNSVEANSTVKATVLGTLVGSGTATGSGTFSFTLSTWANPQTIVVTATDAAGNVSTARNLTGKTYPAGVAGAPIALALANPAADVTATIAGAPDGWAFSQGTRDGAGSWSMSGDLSALSVTTPLSYSGAALLTVQESWTNVDGTAGSNTIFDNVEAYAPGNPVFAFTWDDHLSGSAASDTFVFSQQIGADTINAFAAAADKIELIGFNGFASFSDVQANLGNDGAGNATLTLGAGETITLLGVDAGSLTAANFVFDQTPVSTNAGAMTIGDGASLPLGGVLNNSGSIALNASGAATDLEVSASGLRLTGGGAVTLSGDAVISGATANAALVNVDNTISGAGRIGQLALTNAGTIEANGAQALVIDTGASVVVNSGVLEATGSGGLVVNSAVANTGSLVADGGSLKLNGEVTGSGGATIAGAGAIEFGAASSADTAFAAGSTGVLKLDQSLQYTGAISGFGAGATLDLADLGYSSATLLGYTENAAGTGGALTVSDGTHSSVFDLLGVYSAGGFTSATDQNGGTLVTYDPTLASGAEAQTLLKTMA